MSNVRMKRSRDPSDDEDDEYLYKHETWEQRLQRHKMEESEQETKEREALTGALQDEIIHTDTVEQENLERIEMLLKQGADPNLLVDDETDHILIWLLDMYYAEKDDYMTPEVFKDLLELLYKYGSRLPPGADAYITYTLSKYVMFSGNLTYTVFEFVARQLSIDRMFPVDRFVRGYMAVRYLKNDAEMPNEYGDTFAAILKLYNNIPDELDVGFLYFDQYWPQKIRMEIRPDGTRRYYKIHPPKPKYRDKYRRRGHSPHTPKHLHIPNTVVHLQNILDAERAERRVRQERSDAAFGALTVSGLRGILPALPRYIRDDIRRLSQTGPWENPYALDEEEPVFIPRRSARLTQSGKGYLRLPWWFCL